MPLQSQLFRGDPALEAAATSNSAHVIPGTRGAHVAKIQRALNELDESRIDEDGVYGPKTASAVLSYKRKRNIVNRTYQGEADNIVGVMTIAAMDRELLSRKVIPEPQVRYIPRFLWRPIKPPHSWLSHKS